MVLVLGEGPSQVRAYTGLEDYVVADSRRLSGGLCLGVDLDDDLTARSGLIAWGRTLIISTY